MPTQEINECSPSPERIELLKKRISGWLRQSRYRGRKSGVEVDIEFNEVVDIYEAAEYKCAYCGAIADSPDHPFPIKDKGPCVPANVLPCCNGCRNLKKGHDLIRFYKDGHIPEKLLLKLVKQMVRRKGGDIIKTYIKDEIVGDEPK